MDMEFNGALDAHFDQLMTLRQRSIDNKEAIANWESEVLDALEEAMQALKKNDVDTAMCCIDYAMKLI
jgi:hypothetical protein